MWTIHFTRALTVALASWANVNERLVELCVKLNRWKFISRLIGGRRESLCGFPSSIYSDGLAVWRASFAVFGSRMNNKKIRLYCIQCGFCISHRIHLMQNQCSSPALYFHAGSMCGWIKSVHLKLVIGWSSSRQQPPYEHHENPNKPTAERINAS